MATQLPATLRLSNHSVLSLSSLSVSPFLSFVPSPSWQIVHLSLSHPLAFPYSPSIWRLRSSPHYPLPFLFSFSPHSPLSPLIFGPPSLFCGSVVTVGNLMQWLVMEGVWRVIDMIPCLCDAKWLHSPASAVSTVPPGVKQILANQWRHRVWQPPPLSQS